MQSAHLVIYSYVFHKVVDLCEILKDLYKIRILIMWNFTFELSCLTKHWHRTVASTVYTTWASNKHAEKPSICHFLCYIMLDQCISLWGKCDIFIYFIVFWFQASKMHVRAAQVAQDEVNGMKSGNLTHLFISWTQPFQSALSYSVSVHSQVCSISDIIICCTFRHVYDCEHSVFRIQMSIKLKFNWCVAHT